MLYDEVFSHFQNYNQPNIQRIGMVARWASKYDKVLDVGCGRGNYLEKTGATGLEPSEWLCQNDLKDKDVICGDLITFKTKRKWDALYCMDVLEHIHPSEIDRALENLTKLAPKAMLGIANHSDEWNGVELHLIQKDENWWLEKLKKYYTEVRLYYSEPRFMVFLCQV